MCLHTESTIALFRLQPFIVKHVFHLTPCRRLGSHVEVFHSVNDRAVFGKILDRLPVVRLVTLSTKELVDSQDAVDYRWTGFVLQL